MRASCGCLPCFSYYKETVDTIVGDAGGVYLIGGNRYGLYEPHHNRAVYTANAADRWMSRGSPVWFGERVRDIYHVTRIGNGFFAIALVHPDLGNSLAGRCYRLSEDPEIPGRYIPERIYTPRDGWTQNRYDYWLEAFWETEAHGFLLYAPTVNTPNLAETHDGGETWTVRDPSNDPATPMASTLRPGLRRGLRVPST